MENKSFTAKIKNTLETVSQIVEGTVNHVTGNITELSKKRMEICKACPGLKDNKICDPKYIHELSDGTKVRGCNCYVELKTKSEKASCPAKKW